MEKNRPEPGADFDAGTPFDGHASRKGLFIPEFAVEAAKIATWQRDLETDEVVISEMLARFIGLPQQQTRLTSEEWQAFICADDMPLLASTLTAAAQTEQPIDSEYRLTDRQGNIVWVASRGVVMKDEAGKPVTASGVMVDITARKHSEEALRASEERYRHLADMSPDGIIVNVDGRYVYANGAAARILGAGSPEQIVGRTLYDFSDDAQRQVLLGHARGFLNRECEMLGPIDMQLRRPRGETVEVQLTARWTTWEKHPAIQLMLRDVTELKQTQARLKVTSERLHIALDSAGDGIWDWDIAGKRFEFSAGVRKLLAIPPDEAMPECITSGNMLHPEDAGRVFGALDAYLAGTAPAYECEFRIRARDGAWKWVLSRGTIVSRDAAGKPLIMTGTMSDITEKKVSEATVWRHANLDALTGIPNRRLFRERLDAELHRARRYGHQVAILYIDLDRFKEVNDLFGHDAGDMLLIHAVQRMQHCVRQTDTIARLGGDEFAIMMTELHEMGHVEFVCQNLLASLGTPFQTQKSHAHVTASIGVAMYPDDAVDAEHLLARADQAMFTAKRSGKNRFCCFRQSMDESAHRKLRMSNELHHALEHEQMALHYQPIVDIADGRIVKAEALLRWQHPTLGTVEPPAFLPYAEESGLINRLGDWVFEQAALAAQRWSARTGAVFQITINESPLQFMRRNPGGDTLRHLDAMRLAGKHIAVEITESMLLHAPPNVTERLQEYRAAGVQLAVDDYGTGYSSMAFLQEVRIDYLKIDPSFIADIASNAAHRAVVEAMILMAHKLGQKTIAEGVETPAQLALLKAAGCDYAQGFLFSPALPQAQFEKMLPGGAGS